MSCWRLVWALVAMAAILPRCLTRQPQIVTCSSPRAHRRVAIRWAVPTSLLASHLPQELHVTPPSQPVDRRCRRCRAGRRRRRPVARRGRLRRPARLRGPASPASARSRRWSTTPTACSRCRRASPTPSSRTPARPSSQGPGPDALEPRRHRRVRRPRSRLRLIQNHELPRRRRARRPARRGHGLRPGRAERRRLHGHRDRPQRSQPRRVGRHLRHLHQLRRRPDPVGHVADLRGDRDQGRHGLERRRQDRHLLAGPRLRLRGLRRRPRAAQAHQGLRPLRPRGARDRPEPAPRSTCPRTPAAPTASSTAGPRPRGAKLAPASPTSSAPPTAPSRRWRSSWTTARSCPTSPT